VRASTAALALVLVLFLAGNAAADGFYPAVRVQCDAKAAVLKLVNAGAYNEAGLRKSDARRGIYVPTPADPGTQIRCDTPPAKFVVTFTPVFGRAEHGDTVRLSISRDGKTVLEETMMDDDRAGLKPDSFIVSVTVGRAGEPKIERNRAPVRRGGSPAKP
jgi:hypothetical protein